MKQRSKISFVIARTKGKQQSRIVQTSFRTKQHVPSFMASFSRFYSLFHISTNCRTKPNKSEHGISMFAVAQQEHNIVGCLHHVGISNSICAKQQKELLKKKSTKQQVIRMDTDYEITALLQSHRL